MASLDHRLRALEQSRQESGCLVCGHSAVPPPPGSVSFVIVAHVDVWRCPACGHQLAFTMNLDRPGEGRETVWET